MKSGSSLVRGAFLTMVALSWLVPGPAIAAAEDAPPHDQGGTEGKAGRHRIGHWYGGHTTPLDKAVLPKAELRSISAQLDLPSASIPDNYGDFLRFLKGKGVELFANKVAMDLRNIGDDRFDHAVTPVALEKMVELFERAAVTVAY